MQRVDGDFLPLQFARHVNREHDLRELGSAVRLNAVPIMLEQWVTEVDRCLTRRGDVDDTCWRRSLQQRQQETTEHVCRQVVDLKRQLQSILAVASGWFDADA